MLGGTWYLNRHWWDAGASMACFWERKKGNDSGYWYNLKIETY